MQNFLKCFKKIFFLIFIIFIFKSSLNANYIEDSFNLSIAFYNEGLYENALKELEKIEKKLNKPFPSLYNNKGLIYEKLKLTYKAEKSYLKALALNPENYDAMNNLGYLYAESGKDVFTAISLCQRAVKSDPDNFNYVDSLGWAYFKAGLFNRAVKIFKNIIKRDPFYYPSYYKLGLAYERSKMYFKALEYYNEVNRICIAKDNYSRLYFLSNIAYIRILSIREEYNRMERRYTEFIDKIIKVKKIDNDIKEKLKNIFYSYRQIALIKVGIDFFNQSHKNKMNSNNFNIDMLKKENYYKYIEPDIRMSSDIVFNKNNNLKSLKYGYNPFLSYIEDIKEIRRKKYEHICFDNMRMIYMAYMLYNMEHEAKMKDLDIQKLVDENYLPEIPVCPFNGKYSINNMRIKCSKHGNLSK